MKTIIEFARRRLVIINEYKPLTKAEIASLSRNAGNAWAEIEQPETSN